MQNLLNQFIQDFQTHQNYQKEEQELLAKLFKEYPIYCILTFLIVNIIYFYIKNILSSFINRIKNLDLRTLFLFLLSVSILNDIVHLLYNF